MHLFLQKRKLRLTEVNCPKLQAENVRPKDLNTYSSLKTASRARVPLAQQGWVTETLELLTCSTSHLSQGQQSVLTLGNRSRQRMIPLSLWHRAPGPVKAKDKTKIRSLRESVENTTHMYTDREHQFTWLWEEVKGSSAGTPPSPANDRCFTLVQSPGTSVRSETKKPGFVLAAKLPFKEKISQDNRFLWGEHKSVGRWLPIKKHHP